MNQVSKVLEQKVKALQESLNHDVNIKTIRLLFDISLLRAVQQMHERGDYRGDTFSMSSSATWYFEESFELDQNQDLFIYDCKYLEARRDYDYSRAVVHWFFEQLLDETLFVEDRLAFLAIELPDYYMCRGDFPDYLEDDVVVNLFKKAMINFKDWCYLDKSKREAVRSFIYNY